MDWVRRWCWSGSGQCPTSVTDFFGNRIWANLNPYHRKPVVSTSWAGPDHFWRRSISTQRAKTKTCPCTPIEKYVRNIQWEYLTYIWSVQLHQNEIAIGQCSKTYFRQATLNGPSPKVIMIFEGNERKEQMANSQSQYGISNDPFSEVWLFRSLQTNIWLELLRS